MNTAWHAALDFQSLLVVSEALARAGLERTESRGAHTRDDHPQYDPELGKQNIILNKQDDGSMRVRREPLPKMPDDLKQIMKDLDN